MTTSSLPSNKIVEIIAGMASKGMLLKLISSSVKYLDDLTAKFNVLLASLPEGDVLDKDVLEVKELAALANERYLPLREPIGQNGYDLIMKNVFSRSPDVQALLNIAMGTAYGKESSVDSVATHINNILEVAASERKRLLSNIMSLQNMVDKAQSDYWQLTGGHMHDASLTLSLDMEGLPKLYKDKLCDTAVSGIVKYLQFINVSSSKLDIQIRIDQDKDEKVDVKHIHFSYSTAQYKQMCTVLFHLIDISRTYKNSSSARTQLVKDGQFNMLAHKASITGSVNRTVLAIIEKQLKVSCYGTLAGLDCSPDQISKHIMSDLKNCDNVLVRASSTMAGLPLISSKPKMATLA